MLRIGKLDNEAHANRIADYLYLRGIENDIDKGSDGQWALWIVDENQIPEAREILERFQNDPDQADFRDLASQADKKRSDELAEDEAAIHAHAERSGFPASRITEVTGVIDPATAV